MSGILSLESLLQSTENLNEIDETFEEEKKYKNTTRTDSMKAISEEYFGFQTDENVSKSSPNALNVTFEDIQNDALRDVSEYISESLVDNLTSAFFIDAIVEQSIEENLLNATIQEATGVEKTVVRDGKLVKKIQCPEGFKSSDGKCVKMKTDEIRTRMKAAKLAAKSRRTAGGGANMAAMKLRAKSMKLRDRKESIVNKTRIAG